MVNHLTAWAAGRQWLEWLLGLVTQRVQHRDTLGWVPPSTRAEGAGGVSASGTACSQAAWGFPSEPLPYSLGQNYFPEKCYGNTWKQGWSNLFEEGKGLSIIHPMLHHMSIMLQACTAASLACTCSRIRPPPCWEHFRTGSWWAKWQCWPHGLSAGGICSRPNRSEEV